MGKRFQSTSPVWRTTPYWQKANQSRYISIHVPRVEDDDSKYSVNNTARNFNPRPPCGGRLQQAKEQPLPHRFQSTSPVWRTTLHIWRVFTVDFKFQSTSPVWRTTMTDTRMLSERKHFNPRPPCGGRLFVPAHCRVPTAISIHVPRVEDDARMITAHSPSFPFQSTSPVWRTTRCISRAPAAHWISIHVPRVEDDNSAERGCRRCCNFNPRPPCGGRLRSQTIEHRKWIFQSTSPVWRTTLALVFTSCELDISIHVPRVEDDPPSVAYRASLPHFNPRPPCGGRPVTEEPLGIDRSFQSTSPVWRTTVSIHFHLL